MLRKLSVVFLSAGALALGACSSSSTSTNLCTGVTAPCTAFPTGTTEATISAAVNTAAAGTTFIFGTGTFNFTNGLTPPNAAGLTFTGQGIGVTLLDFSGQVAGAAGITASGNSKLTFANFTIQNTKGDGIKVVSGNGILFEKVEATWTDANHPLLHGAYGIYPVQSQSILIDNCVASGARDTGIYVGQSYNIVVSNNTVLNNVAGIEIESSVNADVFANNAHDNSGGILVFALPTLLPPPGTPPGTTDGTKNVHVFNNNIHDNNTTNFGDPSGTVAAVPAGTGSFVLASQNVEVNNNMFTNNNSNGFSVVSYFIIAPAGWDPTSPTDNPTGLNPFASNIYVHDNTFTTNGTQPISENESPDGGTSTNPLGTLLAALVAEGGFASNGNAVPNLLWDGIANEGPPLNYVPPNPPGTTSGTPANPTEYFFQNNGTGQTFCNLNFPVLLPCGNATCLTITGLAFNATGFTVTSTPAGFPLPAVDAGVLP